MTSVRAILIRDKKILVMKRSKLGDEYYFLPGGGVHPDESNETALVREMHEETNLAVQKARLVFIEEPGEPYGTQYVFLCQDPGGEPSLRQDSDEAKISVSGRGNNRYELTWLSFRKFKKASFRSERLKIAILDAIDSEFPSDPVTLSSF